MNRHFDSIIIGAGQAGPSLAGRQTQAGHQVALIERKLFGCTCVNTGCVPTKAMVASARAAHISRRASDFGVTILGSIQVDLKAVKARKDAISAKSRNGGEHWLRGMKNCTVFHESARFVSSYEIAAGSETISADRIFINVGGRAVGPNLPAATCPCCSATTKCSTRIISPECGSGHRATSPAAKTPEALVSRY